MLTDEAGAGHHLSGLQAEVATLPRVRPSCHHTLQRLRYGPPAARLQLRSAYESCHPPQSSRRLWAHCMLVVLRASESGCWPQLRAELAELQKKVRRRCISLWTHSNAHD